MNNDNIFSEEEAINITIEHGYDGSEFKTKVWKDRGCLSTNRTMDALINKLKTIYLTVEVEGKGKKRKYILANKKEEITEREYNYKGTVPTVEDGTMKEFIFNHLVERGTGIPKSYNKWGEEFELFQPTSFSNRLIDEMKELHSGLYFNPNEVVSEFINAIKNHNKALVHNSFNRLEREGRISQSSVYIFKTVEGNHMEVSKEEYEDAIAFKKDFVDSLGVDFRHYVLSYHSFHKNTDMKSIIMEVDEQMAKEFNIDYMYEMVKVTIIDNKVLKEIPRDEFIQAYFKKFIKLSKDRQNMDSYKNTKSFWRRTYLMNTLNMLSLILKDIIVEGLEELKREEMKRKSKEESWDYFN